MKVDQNDKESDRLEQKNNERYEMLAFILSGSVRIKTFATLAVGSSYACEIARKNNLRVASIYRALRDLQAKNVIKCRNPDSKRRKFYDLTERAQELKEEVLKRLKFEN